ncbi:hypothetical protein QBC34DRAFT_149253 [Podospora aff. communis PSN243]|uniref:Uncharacterized protein n=1 Tax=Podospora aff. communis PSN243 TaxID=3040156 RepID=A0AAV9GEC2_9PEZI|nr:hypothetical protein QBC34DRAFT_149253 [Podospora aff. communis PSN243]
MLGIRRRVLAATRSSNDTRQWPYRCSKPRDECFQYVIMQEGDLGLANGAVSSTLPRNFMPDSARCWARFFHHSCSGDSAHICHITTTESPCYDHCARGRHVGTDELPAVIAAVKMGLRNWSLGKNSQTVSPRAVRDPRTDRWALCRLKLESTALAPRANSTTAPTHDQQQTKWLNPVHWMLLELPNGAPFIQLRGRGRKGACFGGRRTTTAVRLSQTSRR